MSQQSDMYWRFGLGYFGLYVTSCIFATSPHPLGGPIALGGLLLIVSPVFYWMIQLDHAWEGRSRRDVFNWRGQSWSLYGDALLLMPAAVVAKYAWYDDHVHLPWWARHGWWLALAAVGGWLFAIVFQLLDQRRYPSESLDGPAKVYHDDVLIPVYVGVLIGAALPVLIAWDGYQVPILSLIGGWIVLAAVDGLRYGLKGKYRLEPEMQHPRWDEKKFCRISD